MAFINSHSGPERTAPDFHFFVQNHCRILEVLVELAVKRLEDSAPSATLTNQNLIDIIRLVLGT